MNEDADKFNADLNQAKMRTRELAKWLGEADVNRIWNLIMPLDFYPSDDEELRTIENRWSEKLRASLDKKERDRLQIVIDIAEKEAN